MVGALLPVLEDGGGLRLAPEAHELLSPEQHDDALWFQHHRHPGHRARHRPNRPESGHAPQSRKSRWAFPSRTDVGDLDAGSPRSPSSSMPSAILGVVTITPHGP